MANLSHLGCPGNSVSTAKSHKFRMGSGFDYTPLFQNVNNVGVHGGSESMGNHQCRFPCGESAETAQPILLRP